MLSGFQFILSERYEASQTFKFRNLKDYSEAESCGTGVRIKYILPTCLNEKLVRGRAPTNLRNEG